MILLSLVVTYHHWLILLVMLLFSINNYNRIKQNHYSLLSDINWPLVVDYQITHYFWSSTTVILEQHPSSYNFFFLATKHNAKQNLRKILSNNIFQKKKNPNRRWRRSRWICRSIYCSINGKLDISYIHEISSSYIYHLAGHLSPNPYFISWLSVVYRSLWPVPSINKFSRENPNPNKQSHKHTMGSKSRNDNPHSGDGASPGFVSLPICLQIYEIVIVCVFIYRFD